MSKIYHSVTELVGHTPMVRLRHIETALGLKAHLVAKLECFNPAGSVKDRVALEMIDDAERADILKNEDIPASIRAVLGNSQSDRINTMVSSLISASADSPAIAMTEDVGVATNALRDFLFERVYTHSIAKREESKAQELLISLYEYFLAHPDKMPSLYFGNIERDGKERCACDYVAGMSDRYAVELYKNLYVPKVWRGPLA